MMFASSSTEALISFSSIFLTQALYFRWVLRSNEEDQIVAHDVFKNSKVAI